MEIYRGARRRDEVADDDVRDYYWHFALLGCLAECSFGSVVYCSSGRRASSARQLSNDRVMTAQMPYERARKLRLELKKTELAGRKTLASKQKHTHRYARA